MILSGDNRRGKHTVITKRKSDDWERIQVVRKPQYQKINLGLISC